MNIDNPRNFVFRGAGIIILIAIIIFSYFRFDRYINGPEINQINLELFENTEEKVKHLEIELENTKKILINNKDVLIQENNYVKDTLSLSPGLNKIYINLEDPFGKSKEYTYTIYSTQDTSNYPENIAEAKSLLNKEPELQKGS